MPDFFPDKYIFLRNIPEKLCRNFKFDSLVVGQVMEPERENIYVTLSCTKGQQCRRVTTISDDGTAAERIIVLDL